MAKRNISKELIKQPVDLRSQRSRMRGSGQPIGNVIGDPLAAGYFGNGRSNRDIEGGGLINNPGQAQPYPGNTFTDESYQPPVFNPCPTGYIQNPGATGDYDDPYCVPSTSMPGGESFISEDDSGFGMTVGDSIAWNSVPAGDPFADGPEDQPGFGEGWLPESGNCPMGFVMGSGGTCLPDIYGGWSPGSNPFHWSIDNGEWSPVPGEGFYQFDPDEFGMTVDPDNPNFGFDSSEIDAFTSWAYNFGPHSNSYGADSGMNQLDPNDPETWCHYQGMSMGADGECTGDFYTPPDTPDDWDEDYCWNGNHNCDCYGEALNWGSWYGCGEQGCQGSDCVPCEDQPWGCP